MQPQAAVGGVVLRRLAGVFALLFFMSGGEGQASVQATFLVLMAVCLALAEALPVLRASWQSYLLKHPSLDRELNLFASRWNAGI